jgi:hypothetical protein
MLSRGRLFKRPLIFVANPIFLLCGGCALEILRHDKEGDGYLFLHCYIYRSAGNRLPEGLFTGRTDLSAPIRKYILARLIVLLVLRTYKKI